VLQLAQRTNQFNCTTRRETASHFAPSAADETLQAHVWVIEAHDDFGVYGTVGVVFFRRCADTGLLVDNFILSCRVLGRGVPHRILRRLESECPETCPTITFSMVPSSRNTPARRFFENDLQLRAAETPHGLAYVWRAGGRVFLRVMPHTIERRQNPHRALLPADEWDASAVARRRRNHLVEMLANQDAAPAKTVAATRVPPTGPTTSALLDAARRVLRIADLQPQDNVFDRGAESIDVAYFVVEAERLMGAQIDIAHLFAHPTVPR
jgi:aryl carrier-like protein